MKSRSMLAMFAFWLALCTAGLPVWVGVVVVLAAGCVMGGRVRAEGKK